eukprot:scaffold67455_cov22-Tisochrysis_lutea.AAC.2
MACRNVVLALHNLEDGSSTLSLEIGPFTLSQADQGLQAYGFSTAQPGNRVIQLKACGFSAAWPDKWDFYGILLRHAVVAAHSVDKGLPTFG